MANKRRTEKQPREYTKRQLSHFKKQQRRQRIIFIGGISVIAAIVLIILSGWFFGEYYPLNKTIVKVYDTRIKESMLIDAMDIITRTQGNVDLQQQADYILNALVQYELNRQAAEKLGVTVSDEEVKTQLEQTGYPENDATRSMIRNALLAGKLQTEYFNDQVPVSDTQVLMNAMLVESEELVPGLRDRIVNGDNFTALAEEFAMNTISKENKGVFDWHPAEILEDDIGSDIPVTWAFSPDVKDGDISPGLSDNASYKQIGYWLINVMAKGEGEAETQALLLADRFEAEHVKSLLESGDNLSALADTYSQYSPSKEGHGYLGMVDDTQNISDAFNGYVFNPETEIGKWSSPIKDNRYWTKGGAWFVQVVDKEENRELSEEDRNALIGNAYGEWSNRHWEDAANDITFSFSDEQKQWAIERVTKKLSETTGS